VHVCGCVWVCVRACVRVWVTFSHDLQHRIHKDQTMGKIFGMCVCVCACMRSIWPYHAITCPPKINIELYSTSCCKQLRLYACIYMCVCVCIYLHVGDSNTMCGVVRKKHVYFFLFLGTMHACTYRTIGNKRIRSWHTYTRIWGLHLYVEQSQMSLHPDAFTTHTRVYNCLRVDRRTLLLIGIYTHTYKAPRLQIMELTKICICVCSNECAAMKCQITHTHTHTHTHTERTSLAISWTCTVVPNVMRPCMCKAVYQGIFSLKRPTSLY
jgi:hypothetical protein